LFLDNPAHHNFAAVCAQLIGMSRNRACQDQESDEKHARWPPARAFVGK
jgi:hypothetical protein